MRSMILTAGLVLAGGLAMQDVGAAEKTVVKSTGYNPDGTVKWMKEKEAPISPPDNTTVTLEVFDPKTGKLLTKVEGAPAHTDRLGRWLIGLGYAASEKPGVGDRITDAKDGKVYVVSEKPDGGRPLKVKPAAKK